MHSIDAPVAYHQTLQYLSYLYASEKIGNKYIKLRQFSICFKEFSLPRKLLNEAS